MIDWDSERRVQLEVESFNKSDPATPKLIVQVELEGTGSNAADDGSQVEATKDQECLRAVRVRWPTGGGGVREEKKDVLK